MRGKAQVPGKRPGHIISKLEDDALRQCAEDILRRGAEAQVPKPGLSAAEQGYEQKLAGGVEIGCCEQLREAAEIPAAELLDEPVEGAACHGQTVAVDIIAPVGCAQVQHACLGEVPICVIAHEGHTVAGAHHIADDPGIVGQDAHAEHGADLVVGPGDHGDRVGEADLADVVDAAKVLRSVHDAFPAPFLRDLVQVKQLLGPLPLPDVFHPLDEGHGVVVDRLQAKHGEDDLLVVEVIAGLGPDLRAIPLEPQRLQRLAAGRQEHAHRGKTVGLAVFLGIFRDEIIQDIAGGAEIVVLDDVGQGLAVLVRQKEAVVEPGKGDGEIVAGVHRFGDHVGRGFLDAVEQDAGVDFQIVILGFDQRVGGGGLAHQAAIRDTDRSAFYVGRSYIKG